MEKHKLIDEKFLRDPFRYVFQCALASLNILVALIFLDALNHTAIIASLGATSFIVFTRPRWYSSDPRRLFGGYGIGLAVGILCWFLSVKTDGFSSLTSFRESLILWGGISVGLSIFLMVITDAEHPPAAGISLGLVIGAWDIHTLVFVCASLLFMYLLKTVLRPFLLDLI